MYKGHGAVVIGSETSAGIRDVVASNIIARGTWFGVRIKSMLGRGGVIENMRFDNFVIEEPTMEAIEITAYYHDKTEDRDSKNATAQQISDRTPIFRNLAFSNMTIANANQVASIEGLAQMAIQRLRFTDVIATGAKGFVCEHAEDIEMRGVRIDAKSGKPLVLNDVHGLRIDGVPQPSVP
jgi:hypothetical protein